MTVTPFRHIAPDLDPNSGAHVMSLIRTHPDGSQTIKMGSFAGRGEILL
jgi:hypothetical protein